MKAEIITIGDEILIGQIVDTNSAWIAARLNEAGFTVVRKLTVGDDRREIADAVEGAMRTADAVIVTGGLGPTKDDITKQTLAGIFGGEMVRDRETYERNGRILAARGIEYNELNREQATVPSSAEVLQNMHGTAPGMWFTRGGKAVVSLPGVPFEMKELMARINAVLRRSEIPDDTRKRLTFDKLVIDLDSYELLVDGKKIDTPPKELELLPLGAKIITLELAVRFLTDYLDGDRYFRVAYPEHNLVRARAQMKLVADMETHWDEMQAIVAEEAAKRN